MYTRRRRRRSIIFKPGRQNRFYANKTRIIYRRGNNTADFRDEYIIIVIVNYDIGAVRLRALMEI